MNRDSKQHMSKLFMHHVWENRGKASLILFVLLALVIAGGRTVVKSAQSPAANAGNGAKAAAQSPSTVAISGLVRQPLQLSLRDLKALSSVLVRRVDHRSEGYFGDFEFRGVPLSTLITMAGPKKQSSSFMRPTDLAIVVRNDSGKRVLFSYGELLFRPQSDVVLAFDAEPVMPKRSCDSCHKDRSDHQWRQALNRKPLLPRIVAARDLDADRSIEGVTGIEVVELYSSEPQPKGKTQPSPSLSIEIREGNTGIATVNSLTAYPRHNVHVLEVGDAMGYHGEARCEGALLTDVLSAAKAPSGADIGYVISAADGFRASLSSAELFSTVQPPPILIADRCNGKTLEGGFKAIVANDAIAERWVKSLSTINIIRAASR